MGSRPGKRREVLDGVANLGDDLEDRRLHGTFRRLDLRDVLSEPALDGLGIDERKVEGRRDGRGGRVATGADGPDELRHTASGAPPRR